jgi:hypothetical protein
MDGMKGYAMDFVIAFLIPALATDSGVKYLSRIRQPE